MVDFVLFLRDASTYDGPDPYEHYFKERSIQCWSIPVLEYQYLVQPDISDLASQLSNGVYHGLIVTSPRAATYVCQQLKNALNTEVPCFVPGERTASILTSCKQLRLEGSHTGLARRLAEYVEQDWLPRQQQLASGEIHLLFVCGEQRRDTLLDYFRQHERIRISEYRCYQSRKRPEAQILQQLETCWLEVKEEQKQKQEISHMVCVVVFFSPLGVDASLSVLQSYLQHQDQERVQLEYAAIGPTTAQHLRSAYGLETVRVSSAPNPSSLYACLFQDFE